MAITSSGYDGTVDEVQWAKMARHNGVEYAVAGPGDWKVSAQAGIDRGIKIAAGTGFGHGILDVSDAEVTMQMNTVGSGSRWDLVTMRRDWQPPGGTSVFTKVTGSATKVIPGGRLYNPGVLDDQPIALVQSTAGQTAVTAIVDLRTKASKIISADDLIALPSAPVGTIANVQGDWFERKLDATLNPAWVSVLSTNKLVTKTGTQVIGAQVGWAMGAPLVNRALFDGRTVQLDLELRRASNATEISPNSDVQIAQIDPSLTPDRVIPVPMVYFVASGASYAGMMQLDTGGRLLLTSGYPDTTIAPKPTGQISIRATAYFMIKGN